MPLPRSNLKGGVESSEIMNENLSAAAIVRASWGVVGVLLLLGQAVWRLGVRAVEALSYDLSALQIAVCVAWLLFSLYGEGYRAFQKRFSPRVVARSLAVARSNNLLHALLAPAFCMSLFHATRRAMTVAWSTVLMVICLVLIVSRLAQPWRGIIDAGVVVALLWGALAIVVFFARALTTGIPPRVDPALPDR
jgi:hypothetical protein